MNEHSHRMYCDVRNSDPGPMLLRTTRCPEPSWLAVFDIYVLLGPGAVQSVNHGSTV
jgi:hypothetical protein